MTPLEERNLVWNMIELVIIKHDLKLDMEFLDPKSEGIVEFGNFISGHPMNFESVFQECLIEIERKLPSTFRVTTANIIGTAEGAIGITRIV